MTAGYSDTGRVVGVVGVGVLVVDVGEGARGCRGNHSGVAGGGVLGGAETRGRVVHRRTTLGTRLGQRVTPTHYTAGYDGILSRLGWLADTSRDLGCNTSVWWFVKGNS